MQLVAQTTDLLSQGWPIWSILLVTVLLGVAWWAGHRWQGLLPGTRPVSVNSWMVRVVIGTGTC